MRWIVIVCVCACAEGLVVPNVTKSADGAPEPRARPPKTLIPEERRVYLEDVFLNLKSQDWGAEEQLCLNQTMMLLNSLQNFSLWAVWEWDSISSEPTGLLAGNLYQLGNFDECLAAPWRSSHPELKTHYCLIDIELQRTDKTVKKRKSNRPYDPYLSALDYIQDTPKYTRPLNKLKWGLCVPAGCSQRSLRRLLGVMLARSHLGTAGMVPVISADDSCQADYEPSQYDGLFYAFATTMGAMVILTIALTIVNYKNKGPVNEIARCFCLKRNAEALMKMKKEGTEVLYGIRFWTICLIVLDHQLGTVNAGPVSNGRHVDSSFLSVLGMFVAHDDLFVDSFFMLSGFLATSYLMTFDRLPSPAMLIIRRYVRLAVAYAVAVFAMAAAFPYMGSGPLWPTAAGLEASTCRKNWWQNLLMVSNYMGKEMCLVVSWYIPCDFHYFVLLVLLFWLRERAPRAFTAAAGLLAAASLAVPAALTYAYQLPAVQLFTYEFVSDIRNNEQFHLTYIASHARVAAYLCGACAGYLFAGYRATGDIDRIKKPWSVVGAYGGLLVMLAVMLVGSMFLKWEYRLLESVLYAAVNRPVWASGLALFVLCCSLGEVPLIKSFLSWYPWVPLSRLSYGLYLTHTILITRNVFITRNPEHYDLLQLLTDGAGVVCWGCVAALLIWLFVEAPVNNLVVVLLTPKKRKPIETLPVAQDKVGVTEKEGTINDGYLRDNLPATVQLSSKI